MKNYVQVKNCRICKSTALKHVMSLGMQTVIAFPSNKNAKLPKAPLEIVMCDNCTLLQLKYSFDRNKLYQHYWYESGINPSMVKALGDVVNSARNAVKIGKDDVVIDIGSNDATLLSHYPSYCYRVGFEPSNVGRRLGDKKSILIKDFFNSASYFKKMKRRAKVISACGMFYDLDDPNTFIEDIVKCLDKDGVFIIQMNYLGLMMKNKTYDDICHEHREFYSLKALEYLLDRHNLVVIDQELNDVNGGSIRAYIKHRSSQLEIKGGLARVAKLRAWEKKMNLDRLSTYSKFGLEIGKNKKRALKFINAELKKGKKIFLEGCSTRGLTQMQYMGLSSKQISYGIEKNPRKFGKYYADTGIVIGPQPKKQPDYKLVLPYHFIAQIRQDNKKFMKDGGKLLVAIPHFKVYGR